MSCFSPTENKDKLPNDAQLFHPVGNVCFNDLLNKSAEAKKPLLLYFTSYSLRSTSKMEDYILQNKVVIQKLKNDFIFVPLHLDNKEILPKSEWFYNNITHKTEKTIGQKYYRWQVEKFDTNAIPFFVILDEKGKKIKELTYTKDLLKFHDFFLESELKHIN